MTYGQKLWLVKEAARGSATAKFLLRNPTVVRGMRNGMTGLGGLEPVRFAAGLPRVGTVSGAYRDYLANAIKEKRLMDRVKKLPMLEGKTGWLQPQDIDLSASANWPGAKAERARSVITAATNL